MLIFIIVCQNAYSVFIQDSNVGGELASLEDENFYLRYNLTYVCLSILGGETENFGVA